MLVWFVVEDFEHFEVFCYVLADDDWDLDCCKRIIAFIFRIEFHPIVNRIFYVTNPISIAKNLKTSGLPWMIESLKLFITVVFHEVYHILINIWETWLSPLKRLHVDESVKIVNAESQVDSVAGRYLYFILSNPRHAVRDMDPSSSCLIPRLDNIEPIGVVIYNLLTLSIFLLSPLRSKNHWIGPKAASTSYIISISLWILNFISVHVFKLQGFTSVLHQLKTIGS